MPVSPALVQAGFPRVRGDVPAIYTRVGTNGIVFPACAGMFLSRDNSKKAGGGFPRVRGDVPGKTYLFSLKGAFSPRARGCSLAAAVGGELELVFPACAGMFRPPMPTIDAHAFSPRARGCS